MDDFESLRAQPSGWARNGLVSAQNWLRIWYPFRGSNSKTAFWSEGTTNLETIQTPNQRPNCTL